MNEYGFVRGSKELEFYSKALKIKDPTAIFYGITKSKQILVFVPPKWRPVPVQEFAKAIGITVEQAEAILESRGKLTVEEVRNVKAEVLDEEETFGVEEEVAVEEPSPAPVEEMPVPEPQPEVIPVVEETPEEIEVPVPVEPAFTKEEVVEAVIEVLYPLVVKQLDTKLNKAMEETRAELEENILAVFTMLQKK